MTIEGASEGVGRRVVYRGYSFGNQSGQEGIIASTNATYVFVRYGADESAKATRPQDLEFAD